MPDKCFITDLEISSPNFFCENSVDLITYGIKIESIDYWLRFHQYQKNSTFIEKNKYLFYGIFANGYFPSEYCDGKTLIDNTILERILNESPIPKTPSQKVDYLLKYFHSISKYDGERLKFPYYDSIEDYAKKHFFKNGPELKYYISVLEELKRVSCVWTSGHPFGVSVLHITFTGLSHLIEIESSGLTSKKCFVAMSFSQDLGNIRSTIKGVLTYLGFEPIIIDEIHIAADVTINDAIIAEVRACKFVIADFTEQRHGVYFEAGFALGLGRPVIYTCSKLDFDATHFDTNHYPHIVYSDLAELKEKLTNKIRAWI